MKNLLVSLLKPRAWVAKLLLISIATAFTALAYLGHLEPLKNFLNSEALTFKVGDFKLSIFFVLKIIFSVVILFWLAGIFAEFGENQIKKYSHMRSSNRAIVTKALQILIYFTAFIIALDLLGLDLTGLTIFSGAVGIGIGVGLQKITSNFISGIIILFEKAIEEGDLIELSDGTTGIVTRTGARHTRIETLQNRDIMIPNEDFITGRIINWTYSDTTGRIDIEIGVAYGSDLRLARELMLAAANEHPRCCKAPKALCFLDSFGDSSVNFLLYFWVDNIIEGNKEPKSDVLFSIWDKFKQHEIEIPFPQCDVHINNRETLTHG